MNPTKSSVLLRWADSKWAWFPLHGRLPGRNRPMGWGLVLALVSSGFLLGGALVAIVAGLAGQDWSGTAFLLGGVLLGSGSLVGRSMMRFAWNRRVVRHADSSVVQDPGGSPVAPPPAPPLNRWQRWVVQPVLLLLLFLAGALITGAIENVRGALAFRSFRAELIARAEPLRLADILPPPIPEADNLAMAPLYRGLLDYRRVPVGPNGRQFEIRFNDTNAMARARRLGVDLGGGRESFRGYAKDHRRPEADWQDGSRMDLPMWQAYLQSASNAAPAGPGVSAAQGVLLALAPLETELKQLKADAAARRRALFPVHWEEGFDALLPHLAIIRGNVGLLRLHAVALLAEGRTDEAMDDLRLAFRLGDCLEPEPLIISTLVRISIDTLALQVLWEGCLDHRWNQSQLEELGRLLATRDYLAEIRRSLRGERATVDQVYDFLVAGQGNAAPGQGESFLPEPFDGGSRWLLSVLPWGWIRQNQVLHGRYYQALIDDVGACRWHGQLPDLDTRVVAIHRRRSAYNFIAAMLVPALANLVDKAFEGQVRCDLARVALALERHRLAAGSYPESLASLVPGHLDKLPEDRMDGQPLRYSRTDATEYRLYSVGKDHRDDGGTRASRKAGGSRGGGVSGDLVWH